MNSSTDYITTRELAQTLGLSEETVRRHLVAGILPGRKIGSRWIISRQVIDELIKGDNKNEQRNQS